MIYEGSHHKQNVIIMYKYTSIVECCVDIVVVAQFTRRIQSKLLDLNIKNSCNQNPK